jgi:hypothetical protein
MKVEGVGLLCASGYLPLPARFARHLPPQAGEDKDASMKIAALEQQLRVHRMLAAGEFRCEQIAAIAHPVT